MAIAEEGLKENWGANIGKTYLKCYGDDVRTRAIAKAAAGSAAGCGIAYLKGGNLDVINHTLVNSVVITSGMICDGAKPSCAGKIATSVQAGIFGYDMYMNGQQFYYGDGIVSKGVEETIRNVSKLGKDGMRETDREIVGMMLKKI